MDGATPGINPRRALAARCSVSFPSSSRVLLLGSVGRASGSQFGSPADGSVNADGGRGRAGWAAVAGALRGAMAASDVWGGLSHLDG